MKKLCAFNIMGEERNMKFENVDCHYLHYIMIRIQKLS